ncbi:serum response factor isoform X4 [Takifugu rubripes]|uniref:serum response factor isoform X4 n=1 Tax=Takifugu rubripes TaxID=31033 RepID=UPI0011455B17|nr:serum response factor isoform X4 [Takifugu rubripes]
MLPSRIGSAPSGNGSVSHRSIAAQNSGVVDSGIRPVLIRTGQSLPGVSESIGSAVRLGERDAAGMLGANGPGGPRGGRPGVTSLQSAIQGNTMGLNTGVVLGHGARFDTDRESAPLCSGSDNDSDSGDDDDPAYELSTLTGTQVLLLVASETGHVYTFATRKLQPMITSETGKALIQTCLNSPDSPPRTDPSMDQRMSATGFEETDLTYQVSESESMGDTKQDSLKPTFTVANLPGTTNSAQSTVSTTSTAMQVTSGPSFPITNYLAPVLTGSNVSANGTVLKTAGTSTGVMQLPGGFTFMPGTGVPQQIQAIQVHPNTTNSNSSPETSHTSTNSTASASLPTIVTSSVPTSVAGHMMYPSPHTVMYASTPALADGGLAVLNAFSQATPTMQVSHTQAQDTGAVPQVFLTAPPGTVQIPVSAVQLHPMVIGQQSSSSSSSSNLTELQVVNLDTVAQSLKSD